MSRTAARTERDYQAWFKRLPVNLRGESEDDLRAAFREAYAMGEQRGEADAASGGSMSDPHGLLTLAETSGVLRLGQRAVSDLIASGRLKVVRLTKRSLRVRVADLNEFLTAATSTQAS